MQGFALFFALQGRRALVVGGTEQAARKVELLLAAGAQVSLIARTVSGEIAQLIADARICWAGQTFDEADLTGVALVIVVTADEAMQMRASQLAQAHCVPVNVVGRPALSSVAVPAIVDRGPVTIAILTGGLAPALARKLRGEIEWALPAAIGRLARFADIFRSQVRRTLGEPRARRLFWDRVFDGPVGELALAGDEIAARRALIRLLDSARRDAAPEQAMVHLVGAEPGDPDLPLVFGRGGEEIDALVDAGVAVEVVPGITAALGCAASAGIPLTHRDHGQACVFVTGHTRNGEVALDWPMLARPRQTMVIYMGIEGLPGIAHQLMQHGMPATTPVALIENGTTERERRVVGTLATIDRQLGRA